MNSYFNIQRAGWLSRWILTTDWPFFLKQGSTTLAVMIFMCQIPNLTYFFVDEADNQFPAIVAMFTLLGVLLFGGYYMMYSYSHWKEGLRELHMLPASNLEKFLMRYLLSFLCMLVSTVVAILAADLLQYVVGWVIGRPDKGFISSIIRDMLSHSSGKPTPKGVLILAQFLWIHTFYLMAANLFRSIKFGWLYASIFLLLLFMGGYQVLVACRIFDNSGQVLQFFNSHACWFTALFLAISVLHVWLAYRLFCRHQLVGRFINCI